MDNKSGALPAAAMLSIAGFLPAPAPAPAPLAPPAKSGALPPSAMASIAGFLPAAAAAPPKPRAAPAAAAGARGLLAAVAPSAVAAPPPPPGTGGARPPLRLVEPLTPAAAHALLREGGPRFAVLDGFLGLGAARAAAAGAAALYARGGLSAARVGATDARADPGRADESAFFDDGAAGADPGLVAACEALRRLRSSLAGGGAWDAAAARLGLDPRRTSNQIARYAPGGRYARHRDAPPRGPAGGGAARKITCVYYLNEGWTPGDGGALRLHRPGPAGGAWTPDGAGFFDVAPRLDRLVLFASDLEHEVLPANAARFALTQWWYGGGGDDDAPHPRAPPLAASLPLPLPPPDAADDAARILVSVASYRDPETAETLAHLFATAAFPGRVRAVVVSQFDALRGSDAACVGRLANAEFERRVTRLRADYRDARGVCAARAAAQSALADEAYVLQIDAHTRFRFHWDAYLVAALARCDAPKPILTAYPVGYAVDAATGAASLPAERRPTLLCPSRFDADGALRARGRLFAAPAGGAPVPSPLWCAGFAFSRAACWSEVPYDPDLDHLFFGEEPLMAARLFTSGYDFFAPPEAVLYHRWSRDHRSTVDGDLGGSAAFAASRARSRARARATLGFGDAADAAPPPFGLGTARPLAAFEASARVDLAAGALLDGAGDGGLPAGAFAVGAAAVDDLASLGI